jgi:DNA-directed RNA polymerase subunit RPC12/RpoP
MTVFLCKYCGKTFIVDLEKHEVNSALWQTCPDCLGKIQRGDEMVSDAVKKDTEPEVWFT